MAAGRGQPEALLSCAIRLLDGNRVGALAAQPTGMRANDGSWHYAALTYGDDTATVDLAEAAAVTPDKLLDDKLPPSGRMLTVFSQEEPSLTSKHSVGERDNAIYVFSGAGVPVGEVGAGDRHWAAVDSNTARRCRWMASSPSTPPGRSSSTTSAECGMHGHDVTHGCGAEEGGNCRLNSTCVSDQFSTGAPGAFDTTAEGQTLTSNASRKVNTEASVGGSSTWHVANRIEYCGTLLRW